MFEGTWSKVSTIEFAKLLCATLLALGPRLLDFGGAPAWNARCASFAIFLRAWLVFRPTPSGKNEQISCSADG